MDLIGRYLEQFGQRLRYLLFLKGVVVILWVFIVVGLSLLVFDVALFGRWNTLMLMVGTATILTLVWAFVSAVRYRNEIGLARRVETFYPNLEQRLLTALNSRSHEQKKHSTFLQSQLIEQTLEHGRVHPWKEALPRLTIGRWRGVALSSAGVALLVLTAAVWLPEYRMAPVIARSEPAIASAKFKIRVEPGDVELERGANLSITATFGDSLPQDVKVRMVEDGIERHVTMSQSLDDPMFGTSLVDLRQDASYQIVFDDEESQEFHISVFELPRLIQADATLEYPAYTGLPSKHTEDTIRVRAVEGTRVTWKLKFNKPGVTARLISDGNTTPASRNSTDALFQEISFTPDKPTKWTVSLTDAEGRSNQEEIVLTASMFPNQLPKVSFRDARDARVSPIEEFPLVAQVKDDFGIIDCGITYTIRSNTHEVSLKAAPDDAKTSAEIDYLLDFEQLEASPDELLSYFLWAEDADASGNKRRVVSDMYFAEVRAFEELFRSGDGASQEQSQQSSSGSPSGQQAEQLAELQKEILNGTWKVIRLRQSIEEYPSQSEDLTVLIESQQMAIDQLKELSGSLQADQSPGNAIEVEEAMQESLLSLANAFSGESDVALPNAIRAQQKAYEALLRLRVREHEVIRSQPGSAPGQGSASSQRFQEQLQQLQLTNDQDRYEQERIATSPEDQIRTETQRAVNRLKELAQRQEDLNRQMRDLQSALTQAETAAEREEIERQLKRLRDQQREMVRDADELANHVDRSESLRDEDQLREEIEETRNLMQDSAKKLENDNLAPALSSGTRAQRQFEEMRDELRQKVGGELAEVMRDLKKQARELHERQKELSAELAQESASTQERQSAGLRSEESEQEAELAEQIRNQKQNFDKFQNDLQQTVRAAEEAEPLLAESLFDAFRTAEESKVGANLTRSAELSERGYRTHAETLAQQAEADLGALSQSVEDAATRLLGSETDALEKAVSLLTDLEAQLNQEMQQASSEENTNQKADALANRQSTENAERRRDADQASSDNSTDNNDAGQETTGNQTSASGNENSLADTEGRAPANGASQSSSERATPGSQDSSRESNSGNTIASPTGRGASGGESAEQGRGGSGSQLSLESFQQGPETRGGGRGAPAAAPLTGQNDFVPWSDQLRDVEEILEDSEFRAEAARIRDRARQVRSEFRRHSKEPQWSMVQEMIARPLQELRQQVTSELLRKSADKNAVVPIDRDPVPEEFEHQVGTYFENLGTGR